MAGLKRLSNFVQVPPARWFTGDTTAQSAVQLVDICLQRNKIEELIDRVALDKPELVR